MESLNLNEPIPDIDKILAERNQDPKRIVFHPYTPWRLKMSKVKDRVKLFDEKTGKYGKWKNGVPVEFLNAKFIPAPKKETN